MKIKKYNILKTCTAELGVGVMTLATVVGMLELPGHDARSYVLPGQSVKFNSNFDELNNPIRREKEDTSTEYISYSESQRTPPRAAKY